MSRRRSRRRAPPGGAFQAADIGYHLAARGATALLRSAERLGAHGEVAERSKALDWNSSNIFTGVRGFESHPLRQSGFHGGPHRLLRDDQS